MQAECSVYDLRCERALSPLGVEAAIPRLSWRIRSGERGTMQIAYQVQVASSVELLTSSQPDMWDSGKVTSDQSVLVPYGGTAFQSRQRCYWRVRVWDQNDRPSMYSSVDCWEMGLLHEADWHAHWIGQSNPLADWDDAVRPAPFFRKPFDISTGIRSARAYVSGLGYYELYLNGRKVNDRVLDPAPTLYDRRLLYVSYDITNHLTSGQNVVGVILGNGWYNSHTSDAWSFNTSPWRDYPKVLCQIEITDNDGQVSIVSSDPTWRVADGPIRFDGLRNGETYDARCECSGWLEPQYDDSTWHHAVITHAPGGVLNSMQMPSCSVIETLEPVDFREVSPGVVVYDFGQNIAGWARLRTSGPAGSEVILKYSDQLADNGEIDQTHIGQYVQQGEFQTDRYILHGNGMEEWEPRFTYHGFQYVQVSGLPTPASHETLQARVVHTAFERIGQFACSNELLNRLHTCTEWSYRGNFVAIPTDCPHREKNGWTGDAHLAAETGLFAFDGASSYRQWLRTLADTQRPSGELASIAPTGGWGYNWGNGPAWDSALFLIPWYVYQFTADTALFEELYPHMTRYIDWCNRLAVDHILDWGIGDWCHVADRIAPVALTSTAYYYVDCAILSRIARILGDNSGAERYATRAEEIRKAINARFYHGDGQYAAGEQTAQACALYQGIAADEERVKVGARLVRSIEDRDGRLDIGILGAKYLLRALSDIGEPDLAYRLLTQTDFPSWGYWLTLGATTLWETWRGDESRNHIMFGDINAWMYSYLAGIMPDPGAPGFKSFVIHPRLVQCLTWVRASHRSPYGDIRVFWQRQADSFQLAVTIPANSRATIVLPTARMEHVRESNQPLAHCHGITVSQTAESLEVTAVAGEYSFTCLFQ